MDSRLAEALRDRYAVERELGRGGMATVWLARDLKHGRPVALKVLRPELAQALGAGRFLREIRLTAGLDHPHIVPVLDSGEANGLLWYAMPYVEGETLRARLQGEGQLPLADALQIAREVADALAYAHRRGLIHRDIKPENILLAGYPPHDDRAAGGWHARLADFGIARAVEAGAERLTETGLALGTVAYMSPEQASGELVDARTDVYALGCVLYELLAGEPPYTGPTAQAIIGKRLSAPIPSIRHIRPDVPEVIDAAIRRALARSAADRPASAAELAAALARPESRSARPRRLTLAAATAAVVGAGLVGSMVWRDRMAAPPANASVVVLPLANVRGDTADDYLVDGFTDDLITRLSRFPDLRVVSRASALRYKGADRSAAVIARELGVGAVLEGTLRRESGLLHVNARLVDARTGRALWAELYDRELSQIFAVQAEIADHIAAALAPKGGTPVAPASPVSLQVYDLYLLGRFHWGKFTQAAEVKAREYYRQAVALDSTYAPAWAGLASVDLVLGGAPLFLEPPREAIPRAERAAARALALDSATGEAYHTLGLSLIWFDHDWASAERVLRRGVEKAPNDPLAHGAYGWYLRLVGRFDEAWAETARAATLDPLNWLFHQNAAYHLYLTRRYPEALNRCRRVEELLESGCDGTEASVHLQQGDAPKAVQRLTRSMRTGDSASGSPLLGYAYARAGRGAEARRELAAIERRRARGLASAADLALVHLGLGEADRTLALLEEAAGEHPSASTRLAFIGVDPVWDSLRDTPRFQAVLERVGLGREAAAQAGGRTP